MNISLFTFNTNILQRRLYCRKAQNRKKTKSRGFLFREEVLWCWMYAFKVVWCSSQTTCKRQKKVCSTNFQTHPNSEILFVHTLHNRRRYNIKREKKFTSTEQSQLLVYFSLFNSHTHTHSYTRNNDQTVWYKTTSLQSGVLEINEEKSMLNKKEKKRSKSKYEINWVDFKSKMLTERKIFYFVEDEKFIKNIIQYCANITVSS